MEGMNVYTKETWSYWNKNAKKESGDGDPHETQSNDVAPNKVQAEEADKTK